MPAVSESYIRRMRELDMASVLDIIAMSYRPLKDEELVGFIKDGYAIEVVEKIKRAVSTILGVMAYKAFNNRFHVEILAVHPDHRRKGLGCKLVSKLVSKLEPQGRTRILLEVRETNMPAQFFLRKMQFRAVSVLRDFYEDTHEDAYVMQYRYRSNPAKAPPAS